MAVILEEKKDNIGIVSIVSWILILIIIALAVYYIFFKDPQIIDVRVPPSFENIERISNIELFPETIINSFAFKLRRQHVPPLQIFPENFGHVNPFIPFPELQEP